MTQISFKALKKLTTKQRLEAIQDPYMGRSLLMALTPTQYADLFPKDYLRGDPDIGGFRLALTRTTQEQREASEQDLLQRLKKVEGQADIVERLKGRVSEIYKRITGGKSINDIPKLTDEQSQAFTRLQSGKSIDANSQDGKIFSKLSKTELQSIGVTLSQDEKGNSVYTYAAPEAGREEAVSRLKTGGTSSNKFFDSIIRAEGTGKYGDPYNTSLGYTKSPKPLTEMSMREVLEWGDNIRHNTDIGRKTNSSAKGAFQITNQTQRDAMNALGIGLDEKFSPENQRRMAAWRASVGNGLSAWEGFKQHPEDRQIAESSMKEGLHNQTTAEIKPLGPDGKYSDEQIAEMQKMLINEKNATRRTQLAQLLSQYGDTASVTGGEKTPAGSTAIGTTKWSQITPMGGSGMCGRGVLYLSQKLFPDNDVLSQQHRLGGNANEVASGKINVFQRSGMYQQGEPISGDKLTPEFLNSLPPGTILANQGGDHRGLGHIQMKVGDRWMSDHAQKQFYGPHTLATRDYHSYVILKLTPQGEQKLAERGFLTGPSQTAAVSGSAQPAAAPPPATPKQAQKEEIPVNATLSAREVQQEKEAAKVEGVKHTNTEAASPAPPDAPQKANAAEKPKIEPRAPAPTATRFKFDKESYLNEVGNKHPMAYSFVGPGRDGVWKQTVEGLQKAESEGVLKFNQKSGEVTINDMNHPRVKEILNDMKNNDLDRSTFMKQINENPKAEPTKVKGAALGGSFNVQDGQIQAYPIDGIKNDNTLVVNKKQEPLFTMDTKTEAAVFDPSQGRVNVMPTTKVKGDGMNPMQRYDLTSDFDSLRNEMMAAIKEAGKPAKEAPDVERQETYTNHSGLLSQAAELTRTPYLTPSMYRAMNNIRFQETGDGTTDNHYSYGKPR